MVYIDGKGKSVNDEDAEISDEAELRNVYRLLNPLQKGQQPSKEYLRNEENFVLAGIEELVMRDGIGN